LGSSGSFSPVTEVWQIKRPIITLFPLEVRFIPETFLKESINTASSESICMWLELLNLILGIVFGYFHHGKEDYTGLLRNGAITGIVMGIVFVLIAIYLVPAGTSINIGFLGIFGIFIEIIIFVIIFILGAFAGDRLESVLKK
jgi:hypothetical protein